jgi:hypothetical protein
MSVSIFSELLTKYTTWSALSAYLSSEEGGNLRVDDASTPENPFALIRYVKGRSDLSKPHVRACRSVVWDTLENRPVSVTAPKSVDGETLPAKDGTDSTEGFTISHFVDGVMIGMYWDNHNGRWRIHTRSVLGAQSRYYSQTKTFTTMFMEATPDLDHSTLDKRCSYTWILQHPENRIVVPADRPRAYVVAVSRIGDDAIVRWESLEGIQYAVRTVTGLNTWADVAARMAEWNTRFRHAAQGLVVYNTATGERYKVRTAAYNAVRQLRGNSPRRDYLWLDLWSKQKLHDYLTLYPEECHGANMMVDRWKRATSDVYHIYVDVFKARTLVKTAIPPKYRPLVYALHTKYMEELKPAGKTVDWKTALEFMNSRDTAQKLFVINWELRQAAQQLGMASIPIEPPVSVGTTVKEDSTAE